MELLFDLNQVSTQIVHTKRKMMVKKQQQHQQQQKEQEKREWSAENTFCTFKSTQHTQHRISYLLLKCIHAQKRISSHNKWKEMCTYRHAGGRICKRARAQQQIERDR